MGSNQFVFTVGTALKYLLASGMNAADISRRSGVDYHVVRNAILNLDKRRPRRTAEEKILALFELRRREVEAEREFLRKEGIDHDHI